MTMAKKSKSMEFAEQWVAEFADLMHRLRTAKTREASATAKLLRAGYASVQFGDNAFWNEHGPNAVSGLDEAEAMLCLAQQAGWWADEKRVEWNDVGREFPPE